MTATMITPARYRHVLGHFGTGVAIVTSTHHGEPIGFSCQAFSAISLEPPLVMLSPSKSSTTWPKIAEAGVLCINVLAAGQEELCRQFGRSHDEKFRDVEWAPGRATGTPVLAGVVSWLECRIIDIHEAGDHWIAVGEPLAMVAEDGVEPLMFYRGRFDRLAGALA